MKVYVEADISRGATTKEEMEIGLTGVAIFVGRMKAVVEADTSGEGFAIGKELINGNLLPGYEAFGFGYMAAYGPEDVEEIETILSHHSCATWLRYYRLQRGMTLDQLADASGVNVRQIDQVERGEVEPGNVTTQIMLALADTLGVEVQELLK